MKSIRRILLAAATALMPLLAAAEPVLQNFGVAAQAAVFDCPWNATHTDCSWSRFDTYVNGATTPTSATVDIQEARGRAYAHGAINPATYLPSLHAYAASTPGYDSAGPYGGSSRADANVWGVQGYRYVGDAPFLLTVTATLDSVFSRPDANREGNHSSFSVSLFDTQDYLFNPQPDPSGADSKSLCPIRGGNVPYCAGTPAVWEHDVGTLFDTGAMSVTLATLLNPGQTFYVGAFLDASSCCGVTVDSSHTLDMVFNDASQLVSYAVAGVPQEQVPEPATALLLLGGLALMRAGRKAG